MATSGTTDFNLDLVNIADEAWDRASGGTSELRSGYQMRSVRRSLNLLLSDLANRGLNVCVSGARAGSSDAVISSQTPAAGEIVEIGTVVTVRLSYADQVE